MYRDTITLFNLYNGIWRATVLRNVDLNADRAAILARYGAESSDRAKLHVAFQPNADGTITIGGNVYVKPEDYKGEAGTITFASGNLFSFFSSFAWDGDEDGILYSFGTFDPWNSVKKLDGGTFNPWNTGDVYDGNHILIDDGAYDEGFYNYMNSKYGDIFAVSNVARYSVIPHFEVMGK